MRTGKGLALLLAALSLTLGWQSEAEAFFFCFNFGSGGSNRAYAGRPRFPRYPPPAPGAWQSPVAPYSQTKRATGNPITDTRRYDIVEWPSSGGTADPSREYYFRPLRQGSATGIPGTRGSKRF